MNNTGFGLAGIRFRRAIWRPACVIHAQNSASLALITASSTAFIGTWCTMTSLPPGFSQEAVFSTTSAGSVQNESTLMAKTRSNGPSSPRYSSAGTTLSLILSFPVTFRLRRRAGLPKLRVLLKPAGPPEMVNPIADVIAMRHDIEANSRGHVGLGLSARCAVTAGQPDFSAAGRPAARSPDADNWVLARRTGNERKSQ